MPQAGLLADAGKPLPLIDKIVFTLEKETIPYWNKFLQGYYDASGISSDSFDQAVQVNVGGEATVTRRDESAGHHAVHFGGDLHHVYRLQLARSGCGRCEAHSIGSNESM